MLSAAPSEASNEKLLMLAALTASVSAALFHAGVSAVFMAPGSMLVGLFVLIAFWTLIVPAQPALASENHKRNSSTLQMVIALALSAALFLARISHEEGSMRKEEAA